MQVQWVLCLLVLYFGQTLSFMFRRRESISAGRVSFRECNLSVGEREDCGHYGVSEHECYTRGCCWGATQESGVPWCYHSIPTMLPQCVMDVTERIECGQYGIRKETCLAQNCCWRPSNEPDAPWCFHKARQPVYTGECGVPAIPPNVLSANRIVGGVEARPHSWPWQISLRRDGGHACGGTLINEQWVLTAAHCGEYWEETSNQVVLGSHRHSEQNTYEISRDIVEKIDHPDYGYHLNMLPLNDLLLLKLSEPVEMSEGVSPACMAPEGDYTGGRHCYVSGWGTLFFMGEAPDELKQVMVPLIGRDVCNQADWYSGNITLGMVCAGYEEGGRGSCHGDSGGPLVCFDEETEKWDLTGVVSWGGLPCAVPRQPTVYANVAHYIPWIEETISSYS